MTIDPFANSVEQPTTGQTAETQPVENKETLTVADIQSKIVTTLKGGAGFDAPWIVVHSDTVADAVRTLTDENFDQLIQATKAVSEKFAGGAAKPKAATPRTQGKPAGATQAPSGQTPPPGYVYRSGVSKSGKAWKAFMPIDRNSGLEAIWL